MCVRDRCPVKDRKDSSHAADKMAHELPLLLLGCWWLVVTVTVAGLFSALFVQTAHATENSCRSKRSNDTTSSLQPA